jgi:hypothetical protein
VPSPAEPHGCSVDLQASSPLCCDRNGSSWRSPAGAQARSETATLSQRAARSPQDLLKVEARALNYSAATQAAPTTSSNA